MTELCGIILGAGIYGLAVTGINIPSKLADGGVTGIALLLHNLFGFAPSITSLLFNLPLLLISLFLFGKHAFLRTIVGTFALVFFLHLWESLHIHFAEDWQKYFLDHFWYFSCLLALFGSHTFSVYIA